jgi:hypothetical protein
MGATTQTSGVTAQLCMTDLATSIAFSAAPRMTVGLRRHSCHRCVRAGAQAFDWDPALACLWQGGEVHLHVERPAIDAASDALQGASIPLMRDVPHTRGAAASELQGPTLYCGEIR